MSSFLKQHEALTHHAFHARYLRLQTDTRSDFPGQAVPEASDAARVSSFSRSQQIALPRVLDDQFVIVSANGARDKTEEIADLVPASGDTVEYFRSDDVTTRRSPSNAAPEWKILAQQVTPPA